MVRTLDAVAHLGSRLPAPPPPPPLPRLEFPPLPKMFAPPSAPVPEPKRDLRPPERPAPPPRPPVSVAPSSPLSPPRKPAPRRKSPFQKAMSLLFWMSLAVALITYEDCNRSAKARKLAAVRELQEQGRVAEAFKKAEEFQLKAAASAEEKQLLESLRQK